MATADTDSRIEIDLGFDQLKCLCNNAKHAFNQADYHGAVEIYDRVIDQIQRQLMSKIYLFRASAYELIGSHEQALQDAYRAIFADPAYADGYLCAGNLKHKTDLAETATLYQTGIDTVSASDPRHSQLVKLKQQVVEEISARNTTIMRILPYDLMCHIMEKLSIADRMACAATCKDWHAYMFDSPAMWRDIHQIDAPLLDRIGAVASKHVRRVTIQDIRRNEDQLGRLVDLNWCHVESIDISNSIINRSSWRQFLRLNKHIKSIRLSNPQSNTEDASDTEGLLQDVLDLTQVTDLTYLQPLVDRRWFYDFYDRPFPALSFPEQPLPLVTLNIACHLFSTYLPQLLLHCPYLKHLAIDSDRYQGDDIEMMGLIEQYGLRLRSFHYGSGLDHYNTATLEDAPRMQFAQLSYFPEVTYNVDSQFAQLVESSRQSLEVLRLTALIPPTQTLSKLALLGAPRLQRLELLRAPCEAIDKVIRACPSIRWITLDSITDATLEALTDLKQLQRIHVSLDMDAISIPMLHRFFSSTPTLRNVCLTADHFTDSHLRTICAHKHIDSLELSGCTGVTVEGTKYFARHMTESLLQLTLSSTSVPMHDKVVALAGLESLRCLTLRGHGCMDVSKETLIALFQQRKSETRLSVVLYRSRDEHSVTYTSDMSEEALDQVERPAQPGIFSRYGNMLWNAMY